MIQYYFYLSGGRSGRPRQDSENSQDGNRRDSFEGSRRERRLSSNSSSKGGRSGKLEWFRRKMLHEEVNRNEKLILGDSVTQLPNRILEEDSLNKSLILWEIGYM